MHAIARFFNGKRRKFLSHELPRSRGTKGRERLFTHIDENWFVWVVMNIRNNRRVMPHAPLFQTFSVALNRSSEAGFNVPLRSSEHYHDYFAASPSHGLGCW